MQKNSIPYKLVYDTPRSIEIKANKDETTSILKLYSSPYLPNYGLYLDEIQKLFILVIENPGNPDFVQAKAITTSDSFKIQFKGIKNPKISSGLKVLCDFTQRGEYSASTPLFTKAKFIPDNKILKTKYEDGKIIMYFRAIKTDEWEQVN